MPVIAIDFEASCLPQYGRSFPIEVGIASPQGWSRSWLIRPHPSWDGWEWSVEAEALHGITIDRLHREGIDASEVAARLRAAVQGCEVVADSFVDDGWSRTLFAAAGEAEHIPVRCLAGLRAFHEADAARLTSAIAEADRHRGQRHRAEDDARWLAGLLGALGFESAPPAIAARAA